MALWLPGSLASELQAFLSKSEFLLKDFNQTTFTTRAIAGTQSNDFSLTIRLEDGERLLASDERRSKLRNI